MKFHFQLLAVVKAFFTILLLPSKSKVSHGEKHVRYGKPVFIVLSATI